MSITPFSLTSLTLNSILTYNSYTPTWTASGTAPAIGNAVIVARYAQAGKLVHAYGKIVFGSTSTYGTGSYLFTVPVSMSANNSVLGTSFLNHNTGALGSGPVILVSSSTMQFNFAGTYLGTNTAVGAAAPWTWVSGDVIEWNITYEAA